MKRGLTAAIALGTALGFGAPALADCRAELAAFNNEGETDAGISKDGSIAPLGRDEAASAEAGGGVQDGEASGDDGGNEITKDGSVAPLGADTSTLATSGQEAAAQSGGEAMGSLSQKQMDALARAEAALSSGDEEACMSALEEARAG